MASLYGAPVFTPHGFCLAWDPALLWLHISSDAAIGAAYFSIPMALAYFVARRRDLVFGWIFLLFAVFILACGTTHFMDIWTLWHADYRLQGAIKAVTAITSVMTALVLWWLIPRALTLPSPKALRIANDLLTAEMVQRETADAALRREIAERERTEALLYHARKTEALGQLTAGVAHDFNNLLMVIQGSLEILRESEHLSSAAEEHLARALRGVERGSILTGQLVAFARQQPLQPSAFDVNERIRLMVDLLASTLGRIVSLRLDLQPELWAVQADATQVDNALLNLAINARDAMPHGGTFLVKTDNVTLDAEQALAMRDAEPGNYVAISIVDTGDGMSGAEIEMAFEPFFTTKPAGKGSGLGLSQVYGFARQSGGHVLLHSVVGQGTTVVLRLRRAVQP